MRRIIINCLLLVSIASAVPDGRQKRSFSYIKNLIASTFFGGSQTRNPSLEQDTEYQLYKVPGFDEVLIKGTPSSFVLEETIRNKPEHVMEINPFESFIGTENSQDTFITLQNVNNLLSTGILNRQQINSLKDTMVPMISHLGSVKIAAEENIRPVPVIPETIQPMLTEVVKPVEVEVKLDEPFQTRYSYKQMEKNEPVMTFSARSNPEISVTQRFARSPSLPLCIQQGTNGVISFGPNPFQMSSIKSFPIESHQGIYGQYPIAINRFPPSVSEEPLKINLFQQSGYGYSKNSFHKNLPWNRTPLPLRHLSQLNHIHAVNEDAFKKPYSLNVNKPKPVTSNDEIDISKTLGPIPPQYIYTFSNKMPKELKPEKDIKTNDVNIVKITDGVHCNGLHTLKAIDRNVHGANMIKSEDNDPKKETVSQFSFKQTAHNNSDGFVKEKDELKSDIDADSPLLNHVYMPPNINFTPIDIEAVNITKVPDIVNHNNNEADVINIVQTAENVGKETTSDISHEQADCNTNAFSTLKEKDELKTDVSTETLSSNQYIHIAPPINKNPVNMNGANIDTGATTNDSRKNNTNISKTVDNLPQNETVSHINDKQNIANNTNSKFSIEKKDELKTNVNTDIPLSNQYVYIAPSINKNPVNTNSENIHTCANSTATTNDSKKNNTNILKTVDNLPQNETVSHINYKQNIANSTNSKFSMEENNELKTNVNTDIPLSNQYIYIAPSINKNPDNMDGANIDTGANSILTTNDSTKNVTNIPKPIDNLPRNETVSHNSPDNPNSTFSIVKEKDELETNVNTDIPLSNQYVYISPTINKNLVNIDTGADIILKTNESKANVLNIVKPAHNVTGKETLSEYISVRENHSHPNEFNVAKEKKQLKTNLFPDTPSQNHNVHIPPLINMTPVVMHNSNVVRMAEPEPEKGTLSYYIYKKFGHNNPPAFSELDKDEPKTNVHTESPLLSNRVHISPHINIPPVKTNIPNIVKPADSAPKEGTVFHYVYKQASHNNPNAFSMVKEGDELKTNVNTDAPSLSHNAHVLFNVNPEPASYMTVKEDGLFTSKVRTNSESEIASTSKKSHEENTPVLKKNTRISFKDNPIVVADSNYVYQQNNADGSSMSVKGDKDGVSVNVNEKSSTGRGDIPGQ